MAQKIQTLFIDDLDGSPAEGTVRFALDGTSYEIDLSTGHAQALHAALSSYVGAARPEPGTRRPVRSRRKPGQGGRTPPKSGTGPGARASRSKTAAGYPPSSS